MTLQNGSSLIRIIPADAGSTFRFRGCRGWWRDHPRGCGEHSPRARMPNIRRGSSPRMRGAREQHEGPGAGLGIIPADAGSTRHEFIPEFKD